MWSDDINQRSFPSLLYITIPKALQSGVPQALLTQHHAPHGSKLEDISTPIQRVFPRTSIVESVAGALLRLKITSMPSYTWFRWLFHGSFAVSGCGKCHAWRGSTIQVHCWRNRVACVTIVALMNRHLTCKGSRFHLFEVLRSSHSTAHSVGTDTLPEKCGNRNKGVSFDIFYERS